MKVSGPTFYRWKEQFGGLGTAELGELWQLREENGKLKKLLVGLGLDREMLRDSLRKRL